MLRRPHYQSRIATPRELEVARLIAAGLSTTAVAKRLRLSEKTVHAHLYNLYRKWSIHNRLGLALALKDRG